MYKVKDFRKDITTSWLAYDKATHDLVSETKKVGTIGIGLCAAVFILMSAFAHVVVLKYWDTYIRDLDRGVNSNRSSFPPPCIWRHLRTHFQRIKRRKPQR